MVVCFVPGEAILAAALAADPGLLEHALSRKVVLASPGTLLALLRTVAYLAAGRATANARELLELGQTSTRRLASLGAHVTTMGAVAAAVGREYNALVGTLESRVLVTARRMHDLGLIEPTSPTLQPLEARPGR